MIRIIFAVFISGLLCANALFAAEVTITFNDPSSEATVDDDGGFSGRFDCKIDDIDQLGEGSFLVFDGTESYDGRFSNDFAGPSSGVTLISADGRFGLADEVTGAQDNPYIPVSFSGGPFMVEQSTYSRNSGGMCFINGP